MDNVLDKEFEKLRREINKKEQRFLEDVERLKREIDKQSQKDDKELRQFLEKNRNLSNRLTGQDLTQLLDKAARLEDRFRTQLEQQQEHLNRQILGWTITLPPGRLLPDGITPAKARALIASHCGIDYDKVEERNVREYFELLDHAMEIEKSRNQPTEEIKRMIEDLKEQVKDLASRASKLHPDTANFQKEIEKVESELKDLNTELSVRNDKVVQLRKQGRHKEYRFPKERLMTLIDKTRKQNGKQNHSKVAKELGCHRDTVKKYIQLHGLEDY